MIISFWIIFVKFIIIKINVSKGYAIKTYSMNVTKSESNLPKTI